MKYVRIGSIDLHSHANCVQEFDVSPSNFISHPNFTFDSRDNDIALIKLNKPVKLTPYVRPACLYTKDTVTENKGVASGWSSNNMHSTKNPLYKITLNMDVNGACDSMQLDSYEVTQDMALNLVCAKRNGASKACSVTFFLFFFFVHFFNLFNFSFCRMTLGFHYKFTTRTIIACTI